MTTETQSKTSNAKISEALELLNEAAKEKREELKCLMTDKYAHIKEVIATKAEHGKEMIVVGEEKIKELAGNVDKHVRKDPWAYVAGAAAVSLLLGYLMGSKRN